MSSKRSSKVFVTQGSRTSSSSPSSRSSSSKSSASSSYTSSNYRYYPSSGSSNMGRSDYDNSRPRQSFLRVPDPAPSKDGIMKTSRGKVDVTQHDKRHDERYEPRSSEAKSSDYHKPSSSRKPKK